MAVLAGAAGPTAIAKWAALKEGFLVRALDLPYGVPRKDDFRRVLWRSGPPRSRPASPTGCRPCVFTSAGPTPRMTLSARSGVRQVGLPTHNLFLGGQCARAIENSCHWSLDVTYHEDESPIRDRHLRENFAWLYPCLYHC